LVFQQPARAVEITDIQKLLRETNEAEFLFDPSVSEFLDEVRGKATEIWTRSEGMKDPREAGHREKLLAEILPLRNWLASDAFGLAKERFRPYLKFSDKDLDTLFEK
jgi:hypothetical protein